MPEPTEFAEWIARIRGGDADAAAELVQSHERAVRIAVRLKLTDPRYRRQFDSMDVCQSVMASFFARAAAGEYDLDSPEQLVGLLVKMARNKCLEQVRKHTQQKRDVGRVEAAGDDGSAPAVADDAPGPDRVAEAREALSVLLRRLPPAARELAQRRAVGQGWDDIARDLGGTPQGHRIKLKRAIDEVAPTLGLASGDDT